MQKLNKKLLIFLLLSSIVSCSTLQHEQWTTEDKILEGTWLTLHAIDYGQTLNIASQPDKFYEINPLIGEHPSRQKVNIYMLGTVLLHPIIVNYLPHHAYIAGFDLRPRRTFQMLSVATSGRLISHNFEIGLRVDY